MRTRYPRLALKRPDALDADKIVRAARALVPMGWRIAQGAINRALGLETPEAKAELLTPPAPAAPGQAGQGRMAAAHSACPVHGGVFAG